MYRKNHTDGIDVHQIEDWSWDHDTRVRVQGLLFNMRFSTNIVVFQTMRSTLEVFRSLATKLQKRDQDIYRAYLLVQSATARLQEIRSNFDTEFTLWYTVHEKMADYVECAIEIPRRITGRQQHRANATASSTYEHFKKNVAIPFIDYTISEIKTIFKTTDTQLSQAIFSLLLVNTINCFDVEDTCLKLKFWEADLLVPSSLTNKLQEWMAHWQRQNADQLPTSLLSCLKVMDGDQFPNIADLLRIGCTLPIGSKNIRTRESQPPVTKILPSSRTTQDETPPLLADKITDPPHVISLILDGPAVVEMLKPGGSRTFQEYSTAVFIPYIESQLEYRSQLDLVWDCYLKSGSLKATVRCNRGKGIRRRITASGPLPSNWQNFLSNSDNKEELFSFLSEQSQDKSSLLCYLQKVIIIDHLFFTSKILETDACQEHPQVLQFIIIQQFSTSPLQNTARDL
ncbi:52 kDa repressor of the inhibitor of the protein kinase-like 13, partial [Homarus americanus]